MHEQLLVRRALLIEPSDREAAEQRRCDVVRMTLELGGAGPEPADVVRASVDAGTPQALVPAGTWQRTLPAEADALVSCLVSPGFDFSGFEMAPPDWAPDA